MTDPGNSYTPRALRFPAPRTWLPLLAGLAALAAGGWVYVAARPGTLIHSLWHSGAPSAMPDVFLPGFVRYCLPNGLWSLASILVLHPLLRKEPRRRRLAVISVVPILGVLSELLQGAGLV